MLNNEVKTISLLMPKNDEIPEKTAAAKRLKEYFERDCDLFALAQESTGKGRYIHAAKAASGAAGPVHFYGSLFARGEDTALSPYVKLVENIQKTRIPYLGKSDVPNPDTDTEKLLINWIINKNRDMSLQKSLRCWAGEEDSDFWPVERYLAVMLAALFETRQTWFQEVVSVRRHLRGIYLKPGPKDGSAARWTAAESAAQKVGRAGRSMTPEDLIDKTDFLTATKKTEALKLIAARMEPGQKIKKMPETDRKALADVLEKQLRSCCPAPSAGWSGEQVEEIAGGPAGLKALQEDILKNRCPLPPNSLIRTCLPVDGPKDDAMDGALILQKLLQGQSPEINDMIVKLMRIMPDIQDPETIERSERIRKLQILLEKNPPQFLGMILSTHTIRAAGYNSIINKKKKKNLHLIGYQLLAWVLPLLLGLDDVKDFGGDVYLREFLFRIGFSLKMPPDEIREFLFEHELQEFDFKLASENILYWCSLQNSLENSGPVSWWYNLSHIMRRSFEASADENRRVSDVKIHSTEFFRDSAERWADLPAREYIRMLSRLNMSGGSGKDLEDMMEKSRNAVLSSRQKSRKDPSRSQQALYESAMDKDAVPERNSFIGALYSSALVRSNLYTSDLMLYAITDTVHRLHDNLYRQWYNEDEASACEFLFNYTSLEMFFQDRSSSFINSSLYPLLEPLVPEFFYTLAGVIRKAYESDSELSVRRRAAVIRPFTDVSDTHPRYRFILLYFWWYYYIESPAFAGQDIESDFLPSLEIVLNECRYAPFSRCDYDAELKKFFRQKFAQAFPPEGMD